jgi:acetyltransferase-like isoleucine patch superfamily enzyme
LLLPSIVLRPVLRALGHRIGRRVRIGFSVVLVERLYLADGASIGHLNLLSCECLLLREAAYLGRLNALIGPFRVVLRRDAAIGNANKITRGPRPSTAVGSARIRLGRLAKLTANHRVDLTCSVTIGDYSTFAGVGSQIWTHGYVHATTGAGRYRIDGPVIVGNNVYVGSGAIINGGVRIGSGIIVASGLTVASDFDESGFYVPAGIRRLPLPGPPEERSDLVPVPRDGLCETVFRKAPRRRAE